MVISATKYAKLEDVKSDPLVDTVHHVDVAASVNTSANCSDWVSDFPTLHCYNYCGFFIRNSART